MGSGGSCGAPMDSPVRPRRAGTGTLLAPQESSKVAARSGQSMALCAAKAWSNSSPRKLAKLDRLDRCVYLRLL